MPHASVLFLIGAISHLGQSLPSPIPFKGRLQQGTGVSPVLEQAVRVAGPGSLQIPQWLRRLQHKLGCSEHGDPEHHDLAGVQRFTGQRARALAHPPHQPAHSCT